MFLISMVDSAPSRQCYYPSYAYGPHASFAIGSTVLTFIFTSCTRISFNAVVDNSDCSNDWPNDREKKKKTGNDTEGRGRSRM